MRIALLAAAAVLMAGCSDTVGGRAEQADRTTAPAATTTPGSAPTKSTVPTAAPAPGAAMPAVVAWVSAGTPADAGRFHSVTRDGVTTQLGDGVAFVTTTGIKCMTNSNNSGALACLADLTDAPARPPDATGEWIGGWIDFDGTSAQIGSVHGDPGVFAEGAGAPLVNGSSLRFSDYQCRADTAALICVNYAHQSGLRIAASGVTPFGCLTPATASDGGNRFQC